MNEDSRRFDWRTVAIMVGAMVASTAVQWGVFTSKLEEHGRRLEKIERILEDRSISKDEYERRHDDLSKRVEENKEAIKELQRQANEKRR
jgi:hypothetical protein